MKIEVINEKRLNHIHYCRIHKENNQLSGSFLGSFQIKI